MVLEYLAIYIYTGLCDILFLLWRSGLLLVLFLTWLYHACDEVRVNIKHTQPLFQRFIASLPVRPVFGH